MRGATENAEKFRRENTLPPPPVISAAPWPQSFDPPSYIDVKLYRDEKTEQRGSRDEGGKPWSPPFSKNSLHGESTPPTEIFVGASAGAVVSPRFPLQTKANFLPTLR